MSISVTVSGQNSKSVKLNNQNQQQARVMTPISATVLAGLSDVSVIELSNNATLVFNSSTSKYEIKSLPVIFGGSF
jgi:hypothetical protein